MPANVVCTPLERKSIIAESLWYFGGAFIVALVALVFPGLPIAGILWYLRDIPVPVTLTWTASLVFSFLVVVFLINLHTKLTCRLMLCRAIVNHTPRGQGVRNHIICLDGTNNTPDVPTNVYLLFKMLEADSERQISRYYWGVGNRDMSWARTTYFKDRLGNSLFAGATAYGAHGLQGILHQAYFDFLAAYQPGDRVFIFGFSRGAATARALANLICKSPGIPESVEIECPKADSLRVMVIEKGETMFKDVVTKMRTNGQPVGDPCKIEFLGLWDTVASTGIPTNKIDLFDWTIPPGVKKVCHLVSLDELRSTFDVVLVDQSSECEVEEVWFPGAHSNVGGGHSDCTLSNIALHFMTLRAEKLNIRFKEAPSHTPFDLAAALKDIKEAALWLAPKAWRRLRMGPRMVLGQGGDPEAKPSVHRSAFDLKNLGLKWYPGENVPPLENCIKCEME
jgi:hypothetical protein